MAPHVQKEIEAIFAQGLRKRISVEPVQQPPPGASPLGILDAIQPSLTRSCSTAHLENFLQLRQNREYSQIATEAVESNFRNNAPEQHAGGTFHELSIVQKYPIFMSASYKPEDNAGESTSSNTYPISGEPRRSLPAGDLPAGDLSRLDDASLNTTLVQQMLYEDDSIIGTHGLSKPNKGLEASREAKIRTSQEQILQDEEDARAEREMYDMDHEYQTQMEMRRQNLAKMERNAEIKRSIASAAEARRVVESRAAVKCAQKGKPRRNVPGGSVLTSARHNGDLIENRKTERSSLDRQNDASRKLRIAAQQVQKQMAERKRGRNEGKQKLKANPLHGCYTSPVVSRVTRDVSYDQGCSKSNCLIGASGIDAAIDTTKGVLKEPVAVCAPANSSPLIAAKSGPATHSIVKALSAQETGQASTVIDLSDITISRSQERSAINGSHTLNKRIQNDKNKLLRSQSTLLSSNDSESVRTIDNITTSSNLSQSQHNIRQINPLQPSKATETALQILVKSEQTSSKNEGRNGGPEEDLNSNVLPEIATRLESIDVAVLSHVGEFTLNSVSSPTTLGNHGNHRIGSIHREDSDSLFGDSRSDSETYGETAERFLLPQSSEDMDVDKTLVRESQQGSRIVGQWAIVEADNSKDDTNQTSVKDSEDFLTMQMLDIESKKLHTRTISDTNPIQQYAPNKRQKLKIQARGLDGSKNETVDQDNSGLVHRPIEQEAVESCISNKGRRTMNTTPERKVAKRLAVPRHQQNKKRDTLQQRPPCSNQSTPEPMSLHAMSSGLDRHQTKSKSQARGFAALNSTPITKSRKITGQSVSSGVEGSRHRNIPLSRRNMHLSSDERIAAVKHQLSAYGPKEIRDVEVLESDPADIEVLSFDQEGPPITYVYESSSSSDEDEDEEQAKQRRLLKHSGSTATQEPPCSPSAEAPDSQRPSYARKGIVRKTTAPQASADDDIREDASPGAEPGQSSDSTASDSDTTSEDLLWHYSVTRHTRQNANSSPDVSLSQLRGTFFTKAEANKVATAELHTLLQDAPLENAVTLHTDASGLQTCHYTTPFTDIQITVTRALARNARLPKSAARLPRYVYGVYQRVIRRSRAPAVADAYTYLHLGTFSLLDMANRAAGRAWLAHELREMRGLLAVGYAQEVRELEMTNEMRKGLDALEAEEGYFRKGASCVKGGGEMEREEEVEVWVDEQEVKGPRN
ncbi:hypothetical protein MMC27_001299 [Xylographa pallens]|nr:hypothetical protein [Xylographa pallens]